MGGPGDSRETNEGGRRAKVKNDVEDEIVCDDPPVEETVVCLVETKSTAALRQHQRRLGHDRRRLDAARHWDKDQPVIRHESTRERTEKKTLLVTRADWYLVSRVQVDCAQEMRVAGD